MDQSHDAVPRPRRTAGSKNCSSRSDGIAEDKSGTHETAEHCQFEELENTGSSPQKKDDHFIKESSSINNPERTKRRWSAEEDKILTQMVDKHGLGNWKIIARAIPNRNAQQCRVRWKYCVDPAINREAWSQEEELRLIQAHQIYGNKWRKMTIHFPGRTNHALKEHWRGPLQKRLHSYLASGLLEQIPELHEDPTVPQSGHSDTSKDSNGSSDGNHVSSALPTSQNSKRGIGELDENSDASEEKGCDHINPEGLVSHAAKVSERIIAKSKQRARAKRKLDFLSTPVELRACTAAENSQKPVLDEEQINPAANNISPPDLCHGQDIPSECTYSDLLTADCDLPTDVHSSQPPDPCPLDIHDNTSDLLDMSYCDDLIIDLTDYSHGGGFM